jgi:uncharacterized protein (DUF427 family)
MPRAIWEGALAAAAGRVEAVECNSYSPAEGLCMAHFHPRETQTRYGWRGIAGCLVVDGKMERDAVRTCRDPVPEAAVIRDMVAFRRGVEVRR